MRFFSVFLGILCSSSLFALGISNEFFYFGSALSGFSGIVLLYYILLNSKSCKQGAFLYSAHTTIAHLLSSFWLAFFGDFAIFTLGGTTVAYFFLALPFGFVLTFVLKKKTPLRIFSFAAVWLGWEFFKSNGFLAYPWGTAPMLCFYLKHFIQFIDTTGVWGLSFIVPLICGCFAEVLHKYSVTNDFQSFKTKLRPFIKAFSFTAGLVLILNLYGLFVLNKKASPKTHLNLLIAQQNADPWDMEEEEENLKNLQKITAEAINSAPEKADLIVWSESSLPTSYPANQEFYTFFPWKHSFIDFLKKSKTPILAGTPSVSKGGVSSISGGETEKHHNSACLIAPDGNILGLYSKMKLVAFAEYIPFSDNPIVQSLFDSIVGFSSGFFPGKDYTLFSVKNGEDLPVKFTVPICFEDAFPRHCVDLHNLGSELLINITNDSWSKTYSAEYQHFVVAHFRAIELRTTLVRATNSGYSVVVDPYGNILDSLPLFEARAKFVKVPIFEHKKTAFALFKNWFPAIIFIILIKIIIESWIANIKAAASAAKPSQHWKDIKTRKKGIKQYKPFFAVKRKKKKF